MLEIKFINDKVVKKVLSSERKENREYLVRIISAVTGIDKKILRDNIELVTNEVGSNMHVVDSTVDVIVKDKRKYFNIEINYNNSNIVVIKNNVYLYNMILRQIGKSNEYDKVLSAIQININNYDYFEEGDFIYKSMMMETKYHKVRDKILTIYDINLDFLRNIDYNKIKKENVFSLEKLLYIFICDNEYLLDYVYNGDNVMEKVRDNFDEYVSELDEMLYYNEEDLKRQIFEYETKEARKRGLEEGIKEGIKEGRKEGRKEGILENQKLTIKNMLDDNIGDELILKYLNIDEKTLIKIKEGIK